MATHKDVGGVNETALGNLDYLETTRRGGVWRSACTSKCACRSDNPGMPTLVETLLILGESSTADERKRLQLGDQAYRTLLACY